MKVPAKLSLFNRISFVDKLLFTKHLAIMIESGIPISEAIDIIKQQSTRPAFKKLLGTILEDIDNGQSLEKALSKHTDVFDPFYINLIKIGEESGNLEKNLQYLAVQLKKNYEFKKKVQGALMYPAVILGVTFIAGGAISLFVLPKLLELFTSLDVKLPLSTQILLFVANTMKHYGILIFGGIILLFIGVRFLIVIPKVKLHWDRLLLSLPIIGTFLQSVELSFLCRNLGIMLKSGLTITTALDTQYNATSNLVFKHYFKLISEEVEKGKSMSEKMSEKQFRYIPPLMAKMVGVGEKTGKLDESFLYLGDFYSEEVDNSSKNFSTMLEPIILLGVGIAVAFMAFAIISPIYEFTGSVQK